MGRFIQKIGELSARSHHVAAIFQASFFYEKRLHGGIQVISLQGCFQKIFFELTYFKRSQTPLQWVHRQRFRDS